MLSMKACSFESLWRWPLWHRNFNHTIRLDRYIYKFQSCYKWINITRYYNHSVHRENHMFNALQWYTKVYLYSWHRELLYVCFSMFAFNGLFHENLSMTNLCFRIDRSFTFVVINWNGFFLSTSYILIRN